MTDPVEGAVSLLLTEVGSWLHGPFHGDSAMEHRERIAGLMYVLGQFPSPPDGGVRQWLKSHGIEVRGAEANDILALRALGSDDAA